ncbi:MAG: CoA-acylating methylmalonate-semialdehyde dehydrogenase, partial [bacterium]
MINHWIDGRQWSGKPERTGKVYNPATGEVQDEVALAGAEEVDAAVKAGVDAYPAWRDTPVTRRQNVMFAFRELVVENRHEIAKLITSEHGKTESDALGEVQRGLEVVEFACNITHLMKGEFSEQVSTGVDTFTMRQPLGVVAGITPFNFPGMVPMWMYPLAIAAGNSFVLKPSEKDPSPSMLCAELLREAGLPPGVFNVVHGDKVAVDRILEHPDIAAVSFVGSTPIARYIYENGTKAGKRVQALGGAKNHMVVLPDADMELAADAAVSAGYGSAGERCMAISVVVTVGDAADRLLPHITARIAKLRTGPGHDPDSEMGPLVTPEHRDKVIGYIDQGVSEGADLVVDGRGYQPEGFEGGFYVAPTLFDRVQPGMKIYDDEIFGPVLGMVRVEHYQEAIDLINANPYANGTAVFTNDGGAARKFGSEIQVGMVGVNVPIPVPLAFYSFGGWKSSIFGSSPIYGPEGIRFYTRQKVVISRWPDPIYR